MSFGILNIGVYVLFCKIRLMGFLGVILFGYFFIIVSYFIGFWFFGLFLFLGICRK